MRIAKIRCAQTHGRKTMASHPHPKPLLAKPLLTRQLFVPELHARGTACFSTPIRRPAHQTGCLLSPGQRDRVSWSLRIAKSPSCTNPWPHTRTPSHYSPNHCSPANCLSRHCLLGEPPVPARTIRRLAHQTGCLLSSGLRDPVSWSLRAAKRRVFRLIGAQECW